MRMGCIPPLILSPPDLIPLGCKGGDGGDDDAAVVTVVDVIDVVDEVSSPLVSLSLSLSKPLSRD